MFSITLLSIHRISFDKPPSAKKKKKKKKKIMLFYQKNFKKEFKNATIN